MNFLQHMKPQDLLFIVILIGLIVFRKPRLFEVIGLLCFVLAIPLFAHWIFFTAQRLTMYGAAFLFIGAIWELFLLNKKKK